MDYMRTVENIYASKLGQFAGVLESRAAKCGGALSAFSDILKAVEMRIELSDTALTAKAQTDVYGADQFSGYTGGSTASGSDIDAAVERAARATGLEPALIRAVIMTESSFRVKAVSRCGAQGLMQLMPGTARSLGVSDSFDAYQNVMGGATYLKKQLDRFGDIRLALAAYNSGPRKVSNLGIKNPNDAEQYEKLTGRMQKYINRVLKYYGQYAGKGGALVV